MGRRENSRIGKEENGMGQTDRKIGIGKKAKSRRIWGFLTALWLVAACLAGCAGPVPENPGEGRGVDARAAQTGAQVAREMSVGEAQEDSTSPEESRSRESGAAPGDSRSPESGESQDENVSKESGEPREVGPSRESGAAQGAGLSQEEEPILEESGHYTSKEEVALYLHLYGRLPDNYLTKKEAESLGWDSKAGNLWEVAFGMSIGGSRFGNYEKALPEKKGRRYYECDIDYEGGYRGAKRIIYSDDGLIFYTEDHYKTFEQLYGQ